LKKDWRGEGGGKGLAWREYATYNMNWTLSQVQRSQALDAELGIHLTIGRNVRRGVKGRLGLIAYE